MNFDRSALPVAVIGAGPVGLAAAAELLARGRRPLVFEAGTSVAASLESFRHVKLFSPWRFNVDRAARQLLEAAGWQAPPDDDLPTAGELIDRYLGPLAALPAVASALRLSARCAGSRRPSRPGRPVRVSSRSRCGASGDEPDAFGA